MIYLLSDDDTYFPDPLVIPEGEREQDGLYAIGGDLSPQRLIEAYAQGIFPWTSFKDLSTNPADGKTIWNQLHWYCPMQRFVIFPDEVHISHSMRTLLNKNLYSVTIDHDFDGVIGNCSKLRIDEDGAWLGPQMVAAYTRLYDLGAAHSVEVWRDGQLVGRLYGVMLNDAFFGESMFSLEPSASKVALIHLCSVMKATGGKFIDCQFETPHLKSMGGRYISYNEYMDILYDGASNRQ